jgi:hypothetical protein
MLVAVFLLFTSLLIQYDRMRTEGPGLEDWIHLKLSGHMMAPDQYRIGLPLLAHFLELHGNIKPNQSLPLIEFLCYAFALILLYLVFRSSPQVENATYSYRLVLLGLFLAVTQFPILWIFPWERPETLPTFFYLAAVVFLIVRPRRMPFSIVCLLAAVLSFGQTLMRSDVPVALGLSVLLVAAIDIPFPRPRSHIAILGLICGVIGGATQLYLQLIVYPAVTYSPTTPRFQLLTNLNLHHPMQQFPIMLTALLPIIVSLALLRRQCLSLDSSDKLVLLILLVYLPVWFTLGLVAEIRIFVPYLFLASPVIAKIWGTYLLNGGPGDGVDVSAVQR